MGHRLSRITTRTGDAGETGLADGTRRAKDDARIVALGEVDELNSCIGLVLAEPVPEDIRACLVEVQHDLFDLGGELAIPGRTVIGDEHAARLESALGSFNASLPPLKEFILPGGGRAAAAAHLARTVCRRAERSLVTLGRSEDLTAGPRIYLNRLSDLLFVLSRVLNRSEGRADVLWKHRA